MEKSFEVLYTHQKTKKAKTWQDGVLRVNDGTRAVLYDVKSTKLESFFVSAAQVAVGADIETDRHLITIETMKESVSSDGCSEKENKPEPKQPEVNLVKRAGCKRKRMGFIPPRKIKPSYVEPIEEEVPRDSQPNLKDKGSLSSPQPSPQMSLFSFTGKSQGSLMNLYSQHQSVKHTVKESQHSSQPELVLPASLQQQKYEDKSLTNLQDCKNEISDGETQIPENPNNYLVVEKRSASQILALIKSKKFKPPTRPCERRSQNNISALNIPNTLIKSENDNEQQVPVSKSDGYFGKSDFFHKTISECSVNRESFSKQDSEIEQNTEQSCVDVAGDSYTRNENLNKCELDECSVKLPLVKNSDHQEISSACGMFELSFSPLSNVSEDSQEEDVENSEITPDIEKIRTKVNAQSEEDINCINSPAMSQKDYQDSESLSNKQKLTPMNGACSRSSNKDDTEDKNFDETQSMSRAVPELDKNFVNVIKKQPDSGQILRNIKERIDESQNRFIESQSDSMFSDMDPSFFDLPSSVMTPPPPCPDVSTPNVTIVMNKQEPSPALSLSTCSSSKSGVSDVSNADHENRESPIIISQSASNGTNSKSMSQNQKSPFLSPGASNVLIDKTSKTGSEGREILAQYKTFISYSGVPSFKNTLRSWSTNSARSGSRGTLPKTPVFGNDSFSSPSTFSEDTMELLDSQSLPHFDQDMFFDEQDNAIKPQNIAYKAIESPMCNQDSVELIHEDSPFISKFDLTKLSNDSERITLNKNMGENDSECSAYHDFNQDSKQSPDSESFDQFNMIRNVMGSNTSTPLHNIPKTRRRIDTESLFSLSDTGDSQRTILDACIDSTYQTNDKNVQYHGDHGGDFFFLPATSRDGDDDDNIFSKAIPENKHKDMQCNNTVGSHQKPSSVCSRVSLPHPNVLFGQKQHLPQASSVDGTRSVNTVVQQARRTLSSYSLKGTMSSEVARRDGRTFNRTMRNPVKAEPSSGGDDSPNYIQTSGFKRPQMNTIRKSGGVSDLQFPPKCQVMNQPTPLRLQTIPAEFNSYQDYKQCLTAVLIEHLNIILFDISKQLHTALDKINTSKFTAGSSSSIQNTNPLCQHSLPSKIVQVKKEGVNKDRYFYACGEPRQQQCKFFKWLDQVKTSTDPSAGRSSLELTDSGSIATYLKGQGVNAYCQCKLLRKAYDSKWTSKKSMAYKYQDMSSVKKSMYLKLSRKESSSAYSKDDLWIVSSELTFDTGKTFVARSSYYGPNADCEVQIEPMAGYSPSNWPDNSICHAIHIGNTSSELTCLSNLQELSPQSLPVLPHLLSRNPTSRRVNSRFINPQSSTGSSVLHTPAQIVEEMAEDYISKFHLNLDQSEAVRTVAINLVNKGASAITLIHGVFGAGKSYLLSVLVLFLAEIFELEKQNNPQGEDRKILISSTTNVAVDRILQCLLELGFDGFVRVGSVRKIAKPVLPYSVHAFGSENQELKELQSMMKTDVTPSEKMYIRKTIEKHRLGENRQKLGCVRVVGVTCAACSFACMKGIKFSTVLLDECSQMTESASLLPITTAECGNLVLVGDPRQLDPTIQGSEPGTDCGLEQTMFDRMILMGHSPILLRTQYRCHPQISAIANHLFYDNQLIDGVSEDDRPKLVPALPTLCFLDVHNGQEQYDTWTSSYYNDKESECVAKVIEFLLANAVEPEDIGVITLYRAQAAKIQTKLASINDCDRKELKSIQVSTVDAFQGGEKSIIILSCVRSDSVGFIDSDKRANVALTRARNHLVIVGKLHNLSRNTLWSKVIRHCRDVPQGVQNAHSFMKTIKPTT